MKSVLSLSLPDDMAQLTVLRRAAREALASSRVPPSDADDIETIVGELATNAIVHARAGCGYHVEITLDQNRQADQEDHLAVVTVADQGVGFSRAAVPPPGTPRPDVEGSKERLGGWGLPMVEMLADSLEFLPNQPQGTVVRASKRWRVR